MAAPSGASLFVMVGDISADKHVSGIIRKLKQERPDLHIYGSGGPSMKEAGFEQLFNCQEFSVIGITEVLKMIPFFKQLQTKVLNLIAERKPDAVLLADFGGFNLQLAKAARKRFPDLPILWFISPQVWGSRPWRINAIARSVTKMLVIFPFEEGVYARRGVPARFVGNPQVTEILDKVHPISRNEFCTECSIKPERKIIGIFSGSRNREINSLLPLALRAADQLCEKRSDIDFVISRGNEQLKNQIDLVISKNKLSDELKSRLHFIDAERNYDLMANADIIWAKSGTTALEVTLFGTPMLMFYKGQWTSYIIYLLFKRVKWVSWPNLLSGHGLVPELIQLDCRAEKLLRYTDDLLDVPALRQEIRTELLGLRGQLGEGDYAANCAEEILNVIGISQATSQTSQANV